MCANLSLNEEASKYIWIITGGTWLKYSLLTHMKKNRNCDGGYFCNLAYRPDIDGLRAIAVLSVIFFHADFSLFTGGYLGVDVFFVISGYFITLFLLKSRLENSFSLKLFYFRRAKRILPALFFILLCCLPIAWLFLIPEQLVQFSKSLISSLLFSSNVFFWKTSGYFDIASELKPLIHTWSLSIEEQFYLFFPMVFLLTRYLDLKQLFYGFFTLFIISLLLSDYLHTRHVMANFFLLPTRLWELLAGSLLAFSQVDSAFIKKIPKKYHAVLSFIGITCVIGSVFFFSKTTPNPGFYTLIPIIGTVLIIAFNIDTPIYQFLSSQMLVRVGLISYSLYLWHQPIFAFTRIYFGTGLSTSISLLLIGLTFILGYLTWLLVETPFRQNFSPARYRQFTCIWVVFLGLGISGILTNGFQQRFKVPQYVVNSFALPERTSECFDLNNGHNRVRWRCPVNRNSLKQNTPDFFLTGDSHALQLLSAFEAAAQLAGKNGEFAGFSGCIPFLGVYPLTRDDQSTKNCSMLNARIFNYVKNNHIKNIIFVARWTYYTDGGYSSNAKLINYIGMSPSDSISIASTRAAFEYGLKKTIETYNALGVHVYILTQAPAQRNEPQKVYYDAFNKSVRVQKTLDEASISFDDHRRLQSFVSSVFEKYKSSPSVTFLNIDSVLCSKNICSIGTPKASYYQDNNHLSAQGGIRLQNTIVERLKLIT